MPNALYPSLSWPDICQHAYPPNHLTACPIGNQCSQRGSPSVLGQDRGWRDCVILSSLFLNLPDKYQRRTRADDIELSPTIPAVLRRHLLSSTQNCDISWGSSSFIITAVLQVHGRGRTLCTPISSETLGSPAARPYRGPGRLRTLYSCLRAKNGHPFWNSHSGPIWRIV